MKKAKISDLTPVSVFRVTAELRWKRTVPLSDIYLPQLTLQQKWVDNFGKTEWRNVPTEDSPDQDCRGIEVK